jgi:hypothetical protein
LFIRLPKIGVADRALAVNGGQGLPKLLRRVPRAITNKYPNNFPAIRIKR